MKPLRYYRLGLQTLIAGRGGWFVPYRHMAALPPPGRIDAYPALAGWVEAAVPAMRATLADLDRWRSAFARIGMPAAAGRPPFPGRTVPEIRWTQDWFPRLDACLAYHMVRGGRPRRVVEIGAGHSTRFLVQAVWDGDLPTRILAIDPAPRADLSALAAADARLTLETALLHQVDAAMVAGLADGDILSVDSSHLLRPGSDVDLVLSQIMPTLPAGVIVHIHDIFLPDDYPPAWTWRGYSEQQGVAAMLAGGSFDLLFASHYMATRCADAVARSAAGPFPLVAGAMETSLWLRKRSQALVPGRVYPYA